MTTAVGSETTLPLRHILHGQLQRGWILNRFFQSFPVMDTVRELGDDDAFFLEYVIVLDLDETLLHTEWMKANSECYVVHERPFVREFLRALKKLPVEVVIFTAGLQCYADTVIDIMDKSTKTICHRLYRQHTTGHGNQRWKDLSLLNRDLAKTLIIDNSPEVFQQHPDNGITISAWEGHMASSALQQRGKKFAPLEDYALINLFYWIEYLCQKGMDVPDFVRTYRKSIRLAVGDQYLTRAPKNYRPPFPPGPVSLDLLKRCDLKGAPRDPVSTTAKLRHPLPPPQFRESVCSAESELAESGGGDDSSSPLVPVRPNTRGNETKALCCTAVDRSCFSTITTPLKGAVETSGAQNTKLPQTSAGTPLQGGRYGTGRMPQTTTPLRGKATEAAPPVVQGALPQNGGADSQNSSHGVRSPTATPLSRPPLPPPSSPNRVSPMRSHAPPRNTPPLRQGMCHAVSSSLDLGVNDKSSLKPPLFISANTSDTSMTFSTLWRLLMGLNNPPSSAQAVAVPK